jgi:outer membrane protein OmpA-like peptidoglycan-associated protein
MKNKQKTVYAFLAIFITLSLHAQNRQRELADVPVPEFLPHWQLSLQGGAAVDVGEAKLGDLISPALQLATAYQFSPVFGARLAVSGFWARNRYSYPLEKYKWNFVQPTLELKVDLASLFLGWVPDQPVSAYAVVGGGAACTFNNDDAVKADRHFGVDFQKLWKNERWNLVARFGLGAECRLNDYLALAGEVNANMLPDHFNSKRGKHDNIDWHFNALVGLKVNLGPNYRHRSPVIRSVPEPVQPVVKPEPIVRDTVAMTANIYFLINSSQLRSSEHGKLAQLVSYLKSHPRSHVEMTGYADRLTGTSVINDRLSRERATAVANYLKAHGISSDRIYKDAKGDRVQPFPVNEDNRVTICFVVDMLE